MGKLSKVGIGAQRNALKVTPELFQELNKLTSSYIDKNGHEVCNPKPEEIVIGKRPPSLKEQIQRLVKVELSEQAGAQEFETWEEANDFDIEDDGNPLSGLEVQDMIDEEPIEIETPETPPPAEVPAVVPPADNAEPE